MGRSYKSAVPSHGGWRIHRPCRRGPWPRKRRAQGTASTGTDAFVGMARSYKIAVPSRRGPDRATGGASTIPVGGGHAPESGGCHGSVSTGTDAFAAMGRSYKSAVPSRRGECINRGIYKGPSPCSYALRPSRRGPAAREAAMARSYKSAVPSRRGERINRGTYKGPSPCSYALRERHQ